jgi:hypothetical protein
MVEGVVARALVADVEAFLVCADVKAGGDCAVALDELNLIGRWRAHGDKHTEAAA